MILTRRALLWGGATGAVTLALSRLGPGAQASPGAIADPEWMLPDAEWRERLTPEAYAVLREDGTERPYSSPLNDETRPGTYACGGCGLPTFEADTKFDAGTGWPSFWAAIEANVLETPDTSLGLVRTGVFCRRCGGHLGHVFPNGPLPTGLRYCINGVALSFEAA